MNFLVGMTIRKNVSVGLDMNRKMENVKDYAHKIVLFHNGIINVFVGMDIKRIIMESANQFVNKVINSIIKLKHIVRKFVHGTIIMKENGINA